MGWRVLWKKVPFGKGELLRSKAVEMKAGQRDGIIKNLSTEAKQQQQQRKNNPDVI